MGQGGSGWGGQGGWVRRIEAFVKKNWGVGGVGGRGASGWGVRVDVNGEVKFFCENTKKKLRGGRGRGGPIRGWGGGGWDSKVWGRWVMWGMGDVKQE